MHLRKQDFWPTEIYIDALPIQTQVQASQEDLSDQVDDLHQVAPPIKTALRRNMRKQGSIFLPATQQLGFHMPAPAFSNQGHRNQLAIPAFRLGSWAFDQRSKRFPDIIHDYKNPGAKITKIRYHHSMGANDHKFECMASK